MGYFGVAGWTHRPDSVLGRPQVLATAACGLPVYYCHRVCPGLYGETEINSETHIFHSYFIGWLCVGINSSILSYFTVAIISQWWLRTRYPRWFAKYNYIIGAGEYPDLYQSVHI